MPHLINLMKQQSLFDEEQARSLLDQLLEDSRLYHQTADYRKLLEFVAKFRNIAPFNAMLLNIQKPGITHVATSTDWRRRFGRTLKEGARPLLILWPFGPVQLIYDIQDTEGEDLPEDAASFPAQGAMSKTRLMEFRSLLDKKRIVWSEMDAGDGLAGLIRMLKVETKDTPAEYRLTMNQNHEPAVRFVTLAHELGHLFLGHLGLDKRLRIPERRGLKHAQAELEAESVAYLIAKRNGIEAKSQTYLSGILTSNEPMPPHDLYQIMRAAGQVETLLGLKTGSTG